MKDKFRDYCSFLVDPLKNWWVVCTVYVCTSVVCVVHVHMRVGKCAYRRLRSTSGVFFNYFPHCF